MLELEIFNPGPSDNKKDKINELCPWISLPGNGLKLGQWNVNNLTDEIDVLFLIETFLKPNNPDCVLQIPGYTFFREDRQGLKNQSLNHLFYMLRQGAISLVKL